MSFQYQRKPRLSHRALFIQPKFSEISVGSQMEGFPEFLLHRERPYSVSLTFEAIFFGFLFCGLEPLKSIGKAGLRQILMQQD